MAKRGAKAGLAGLALAILAGTAAGGERAEPEVPGYTLPVPSVARRRGRDFEVLDEADAARIMRIPSRIMNCPICRTAVNAPDLPPPPNLPFWELTAHDFDADLCPHPVGRLRFHAEIVVCQHCGFAAYQHHFEARDKPPEIAAWVKRELTPDLRFVQAALVGVAYEAMKRNPDFTDLDAELEALFTEQETIPDIVRTEHARAYYHQIGAPLLLRVKLTILAAWAYRRAVAQPIGEAFLNFAVRSVLARAGGTDVLSELDMEVQADRFRRLVDRGGEFSREAMGKPGSWLRRQVAFLMLAGHYDRLGYTAWAESCLAAAEAEHEQAAADLDPEAPGDNTPLTPAEIRLRFETLKEMVRVRREQLKHERALLRQAQALILEAMLAGEYDATPAEIPGRMYLVGEFARRTRDWSRAFLWLEGARDCLMQGTVGTPLVEIYAPDQLRSMTDYLEYRHADAPGELAKIRDNIGKLSDAERRLCATYVTFWKEHPPGG